MRRFLLLMVAEGDKIPRKGGPGITKSDLLVINKIDLAPYVGADLSVMDRDSRKMRGDRPSLYQYPWTGRHRCRDRMDQKKCTSGRMLKSDSRE